MATITIRLFARLADIAGKRKLTLDLAKGMTAADAFGAIARDYPKMAGYGGRLMYARNQEYVSPDTPLEAGDELALIPPVSGGARNLFKVTKKPLDPERVVEAVRRDEAGAIVLFYGIVRNENLGRRVLYLEYDAYPEMAEKVMRELADEIKARWPAAEIAARHRIGRMEIGETSLLVAVSSAHRREAFEACHAYVDRLKESVPVWKKEVFEGGEEWIEGPGQH